MDTKLIKALAEAICAEQAAGKKTPFGIAAGLVDRQLAQSPGTAAEAERHTTNEALSRAVEQAHEDQALLAEVARQRLREGMAAEARHLLDPADRAFAELACRCCNSQPEVTR